MSKFLMHYVGGGTCFPFELLRKSCEECRSDQPIRVVITDTDFDHNYEMHKDNPGILGNAIDVSPHFVMLLHCPSKENADLYRSRGANVVPVEDLADFPGVATDLAKALFP